MVDETKKVIKCLVMELIIFTIILLYFFYGDSGIFGFTLILDLPISIIISFLIILSSSVGCGIFNFIVYLFTKKRYLLITSLYLIVPVIIFFLFLNYRFLSLF